MIQNESIQIGWMYDYKPLHCVNARFYINRQPRAYIK